jgi:hypothetical protein
MVQSRRWRRASLVALAVGLWWGAWSALYEWIARSGWPVGHPVPEASAGDWLSGWLGAGWWPWAVFGLSGIVLIGSYLALEAVLRLDRDGLSWPAIRWGLGVFRSPRGGLVVVLLPALFPALALLDPGGWVTLISWLLAYCFVAFVAPFAIFRSEVVQAPRPASWWRPRWPGIAPVGAALLLVALVLAGEALVAGVWNALLPPVLLGWTAAFVIAFPDFARPAVAAVFIHRLGPREAWRLRGRALRWRNVGPWFALTARLVGVPCLVLLPPVAALYFWARLIVPAQAAALTAIGQGLPSGVLATIRAANFVGRFGAVTLLAFAALVPPISLLGMLVTGRLVFLLSQPEE